MSRARGWAAAGQGVGYLAYRLLLALLGRLPLTAACRLGRWVGACAPWILPGYHRLVKRNLRYAFGEEWSEEELEARAREHWKRLVSNLLAASVIGGMDPRKFTDRAEVKHLDRLLGALEKKRGVVMVIAHLGNWELFAQLAMHLPGYGLGAVYQRLGNRLVDAHVREVRGRFGVRMLDRKSDLRRVARMLREGGLVGILVDQHAGDQGLWAPFFGKLASTSPLAASLACRTGAELVPVSIYTTGLARWRVEIGESIPHTDGPDVAAAAINVDLERNIRRSPEDWFWVHNRWKIPEPAFLLKRYKRGVYFEGELKPFRVVARSCNWLGDAVMTLPAVRMLKRGRPDLHLTILSPENLAGLWEACPEVDDVLTIPTGAGLMEVARMIKAKPFEAGVVFPNSTRSVLEMWLGGVRHIAGRPGRWRSWWMREIFRDQRAPGPPRHQKHDYIDLVHFLGGAREDALETGLLVHRWTDEKTGGGVMCPGAEYGPAKRWPADRFAEVIRQTAGVVEWSIVGTGRDREVAAKIRELAGETVVRDLTGQTSMEELMRILAGARVLLTNDTGTMHLAAVIGTPLVAVFGSTEPRLTGPLGVRHRVIRHYVECSPCFLRECPLDFRCMNGVEPDQVAQAVRESAGLSAALDSR